MARKEKTYHRLPGRPFSFLSAQRLWQGPDHLLWTEIAMFQIRYKRFYYKDIQALVLSRSNDHLVWSFVWGALATLFGIIALSVSGTPYISGTLVLVFLLLLSLNLIIGPACQVQLQTAVQIQKLRSLRRVRTATKVLDRIHALIEKTQGRLNLEALPASADKAPIATWRATHATSQMPAFQEPTAHPAGTFNPVWHRILFVLLLSLGALGLVQLGIKSLPLGIIETLLHSAAQVLSIVALVRGYRFLKGTWLATLSWLSLGMLLLASGASYVLVIIVSIRHPEISHNHWELYKLGFEMAASGTSVMLALDIFFASGFLLFGLGGLVVMHRLPKHHMAVKGSET